MNIVYKEYITGRDAQAIEASLFDGMTIGADGKPQGFSPVAIQKRLNKAIEACVVSVDGKTEGVLDTILDLPVAQFNEVKDKVEELAGLNDEKKNQ
jgi:hypothetical protein